MLAEGKVDAARIVTGTVGLAGVDGAFEALADPEAQAKVLIDPKSSRSWGERAATTPEITCIG